MDHTKKENQLIIFLVAYLVTKDTFYCIGNHNLSVLVEFIPTLKEIHTFAIMQASIILSHILSASKNVVPGLTAKTTFESVAIVFDNY
jgi:hypothetical protein